ncbi:MAG: hypothetical protein NC932_04050, partial [Candidatus Omnitrophica bacterium]|nr:hypothetical protein [Candidatus Omnitrophota bacterium]
GSRIKALSVLLNNDYKLPLEKIEQLMGDLWLILYNYFNVFSFKSQILQFILYASWILRKEITSTMLYYNLLSLFKE